MSACREFMGEIEKFPPEYGKEASRKLAGGVGAPASLPLAALAELISRVELIEASLGIDVSA